jgi:hypothetical protein
VAVFNISGASQHVEYSWKDLGLGGGRYAPRDLWEHKNLGGKDSLSVTVPSHGAALYRLSAAK